MSSILDLPKGSLIYISGKMDGLPCMGFEKFFARAAFLKSHGFRVFNPAEHDCLKMVEGWKHEPCNRASILLDDLEELVKCDAIEMLDNWVDDSTGATAERAFALAINIPVYYVLGEEA